jgi:tetratricopeptide (TPR) repeat protein
MARLSAVLMLVICGGGVAAHAPPQDDGSADRRPDAPRIFETMDIGGVDVRTSTLLLSGQEGGNVDGAMLWTLGEVLDEERIEVRFVVEVDGASLLSGLTKPRIAIAILAYAVNQTGQIVDHIAQGLILDPDVHADALIDSGFKFVGRTKLAPGISTLRVMVREQETGRFYLSRTRIEVPSPEDDSWPLRPPVFEENADNWIIAHQPGVGFGEEAPQLVLRVPSARPVLVEGQPAEFQIGPISRAENAVVSATVVDPAGHVVADFPVELTDGPAGRSDLTKATLPGMDLPFGRFTLNLTVRNQVSDDELRQSIQVVAVPAAGPDTWIGATTASSNAQPTGEQPRKAEKFRRRRVHAAYLSALRHLAIGDGLAARRSLAELEAKALESGVLRNMRWIEDAVAEDLAQQNPRSLLPVAHLHQQMVRRYVAHRQFVLATYAREVTADRAGEIGRAEAASGFAEALLVNLAHDLSRTVAASAARDYLERALLLNPNHRPALLALGASLERAAEYDRAVRVFQDLVEADPDRDEGRLRLAVNLAHTGRRRAAAQLLDDLLARSTEEWIGAIAAQERARLFAARDRFDEAREMLATSIQRYPDDQRLRVQYAWILDQSGHSLDAVAAILAVPPPQHGVSPRFRYGEWPDLGFEVSARRISDDATAALPELAAALEVLEGPR